VYVVKQVIKYSILYLSIISVNAAQFFDKDSLKVKVPFDSEKVINDLVRAIDENDLVLVRDYLGQLNDDEKQCVFETELELPYGITTPLFGYACLDDAVDSASQLLQAGASPYIEIARRGGRITESPLYHACKEQNYPLAALLLNWCDVEGGRKIDSNVGKIRYYDGYQMETSPLYCAIKKADWTLAFALLQHSEIDKNKGRYSNRLSHSVPGALTYNKPPLFAVPIQNLINLNKSQRQELCVFVQKALSEGLDPFARFREQKSEELSVEGIPLSTSDMHSIRTFMFYCTERKATDLVSLLSTFLPCDYGSTLMQGTGQEAKLTRRSLLYEAWLEFSAAHDASECEDSDLEALECLDKVGAALKEGSESLITLSEDTISDCLALNNQLYESYKMLAFLLNERVEFFDSEKEFLEKEQLTLFIKRITLFDNLRKIKRLRKKLAKKKVSLFQSLFDRQRNPLSKRFAGIA